MGILNGTARRKRELRERAKAARAAMPPADKAAADKALCDRLLALPQIRTAGTVLTYVSQPHEADTRALIAALLAAGKTVAAPRCADAMGEMQFFVIRSFDELAPGAFGLTEPTLDCPPAYPGADSVCLVPALLFDEGGYRLGYGGGYYDRFLEEYPALSEHTVLLAFQAQKTEMLPIEPTDRKPFRILTETGIV
jgi:5-formyltetrahydrofolate cyclo-ligase